jgi:CubicO group peptidase (beta-lactamase class C family)
MILKRTLFYCCLICWVFAGFCLTISAQTGLPVPSLEHFDDGINSLLQQYGVPGASVAVAKDGRLVYSRGFGKADMQKGIPTMPNHQFRLASLSKPVTAVAIFKLIEQGKLKLDQPVFGKKGILKGYRYAGIEDKSLYKITVRHLLEHSGGWDRNQTLDPHFNTDFIGEALELGRPARRAELIKYMLQQPLQFEPGTGYAYSNFGFTLLGRVIETVSGKPYAQFVQQHIFRPAGIKKMAIGGSTVKQRLPNEVSYYNAPEYAFAENWSQNVGPYSLFNLSDIDACGGWVASAPDLVQFLNALFVPDENPKKPLLRPETIEAMTQPSAVNGQSALGWSVDGSGNYWHIGNFNGSATLMAQMSNGVSYVILCNTRPHSLGFFSHMDSQMQSLIAATHNWPDHDLLGKRKPKQQQNSKQAVDSTHQEAPEIVADDFENTDGTKSNAKDAASYLSNQYQQGNEFPISLQPMKKYYIILPTNRRYNERLLVPTVTV